jgi:hypothetical protein
MQKNTYIKKILVHDQTISELDLELQDKFKEDRENDEEGIIEICDREGIANGYPISIDTLLAEIYHLQSKGANYVDISYDSDHYGYEISGYKILKAEATEIKEYEVNEQKRKIAYYESLVAKVERASLNSKLLKVELARLKELAATEN